MKKDYEKTINKKLKILLILLSVISIILFSLNRSYGNFSAATPFGTGVWYPAVVFGDIDNDGDLDLIVSGWNNSGGGYRLEKHINNGSGNFTKSSNFGNKIYDGSLVLGDIDNDGDLDLIVTGYRSIGQYYLQKYKNDGTGNFIGPVNFGERCALSSIALGDLDGDGDLDLIVTGWDGSGTGRHCDKYFNDGTGVFTGPTSIGAIVQYSAIALGDIDNDEDLDIIITGMQVGFGPRIDKYINNGSGVFTLTANFCDEVQY